MKQAIAWSLYLAVASTTFQAGGQAGPAANQTETHLSGAGSSAADDAVLLDLVVHDKKGKEVLDLKAEELAVTDAGAPVKLTSLRLVDRSQQSEHLITLVFDRPSPERGLTQQSSLLLMKDERAVAEKILKSAFPGSFAFAVFSIERRLTLQQGFTSDRKLLADAVNAATSPGKPGIDEGTANAIEADQISIAMSGADKAGKKATAHERVLAQALYAALKSSNSIAQNQHIRPSLAGLQALTQAEQDLSQRKAILYFASIQDKQIDSHAKAAIESITGLAARAGVSIYVVDTNSPAGDANHPILMGSVDAGGGALGAAAPAGASGGSRSFDLGHAGVDPSQEKNENPDMQRMAEQTGGSYIFGDRMSKSMEQMIADLTTYYEASYPRPVKEYDGTFRPVEVKPMRAGLKIRTQTGYLALPPRGEDGSRPQPFELSLSKILKQTPLPADLAFHAAVFTMKSHSTGDTSTLAVDVPLSSLELRKDSNTSTYTTHLTMLANIRTAEGALVEHFSNETPERVPMGNPTAKNTGAITWQRHFTASPGAYVLEVAVLDVNGGTAGAQRIPFKIAADPGTPSLSDIVLVRKTEPLGSDTAEPLRQGAHRITPNLSGTLPPGAGDISVFFVAHGAPHGGDKATLAIEVFRDEKSLGPPTTAQADFESDYLSYLNRFTIHPLRDGAYQVKVTLQQGGKTAQAVTSFTMSGADPADAQDETGEADETDTTDLADATRPAGALAITFLANPVQPPAPDEVKSILADATRFATDYRNSLPNFLCQQMTNRSVSLDGGKTWTHQDKLTGMLTFLDHSEDWRFLEIERDGHKSHLTEGAEGEQGISSAGMFGAVVSGLFRPASKADIVWKETLALGDGTVQVFDYRVDQANSNMNLRVGPKEVITVGYHGQVYLDTKTHTVRRITEIADNVPKRYPIHGTLVSADYDYVSIGGNDYLMPIGAQVILQKGRHRTFLNDISFREYHRFGSANQILSDLPDDKSEKAEKPDKPDQP